MDNLYVLSVKIQRKGYMPGGGGVCSPFSFQFSRHERRWSRLNPPANPGAEEGQVLLSEKVISE
jgi:hypothetical protein